MTISDLEAKLPEYEVSKASLQRLNRGLKQIYKCKHAKHFCCQYQMYTIRSYLETSVRVFKAGTHIHTEINKPDFHIDPSAIKVVDTALLIEANTRQIRNALRNAP